MTGDTALVALILQCVTFGADLNTFLSRNVNIT